MVKVVHTAVALPAVLAALADVCLAQDAEDLLVGVSAYSLASTDRVGGVNQPAWKGPAHQSDGRKLPILVRKAREGSLLI